MVVKSTKHGYLLVPESRRSFVEKLMGEHLNIITSNIAGKSLIGSDYKTLPVFEDKHTSPRIVHADFVSPDAGTGLVHCAPGHGMEDYEALQSLISDGEVAVKAPVDYRGCFTVDAVPGEPSRLLGLLDLRVGNEKVFA